MTLCRVKTKSWVALKTTKTNEDRARELSIKIWSGQKKETFCCYRNVNIHSFSYFGYAAQMRIHKW